MRCSRKKKQEGIARSWGVVQQTHTSFVDSDLEVKSWAQAMKHFSTRPEYNRMKSCIWASAAPHHCSASLRLRARRSWHIDCPR